MAKKTLVGHGLVAPLREPNHTGHSSDPTMDTRKDDAPAKREKRGFHFNGKLLLFRSGLASALARYRQNKRDRWHRLEQKHPGLISECRHLGPVQHGVWEDEACSKLGIDASSVSGGLRVGQYILHEKLGSGFSGCVYRARSRGDDHPDSQPQELAIKVLRKRRGLAKETPNAIRRRLGQLDGEIGLLQTHSHHPNIIGFLGAIHAPRNVYILLQRATTSLQSLIKKVSIPPRSMQIILRGVLNALQYLHGSGVYHLDVKAANVLIVSKTTATNNDTMLLLAESSIRLCDFGMSQVCAHYDPTATQIVDPTMHSLKIQPNRFVGSMGYAAPELVLRQGANASAADMWSVGCLGLAMLYKGNLPQALVKSCISYRENVVRLLCREKLRTMVEANGEKRILKDFLYNFLLRVESNDRPTACEALNHQYFQSAM